MQNKLKNWIMKSLQVEGGFDVLYPRDMKNGDYSTNIALIEAKKTNKISKELAEEMVQKLKVEIFDDVEKIEVAGPGFINFFLKPEYFASHIPTMLTDSSYGKSEKLLGKKVICEYTDPNPFKEFHIGHLMSNTIGEAISRIIEAQGAEVKRACYQGDVGLHIAMSVWAITDLKLDIEKAESQDLGKAYVHGSTKYKEDQNVQKEIVEINKKIFSREDSLINKIYDSGRKVSLDYFETIYKKLGTKFDFYFFESEVSQFGKEVVEKNLGSIFEKSDGAIIFHGEEHDSSLHTRVFINKEGLPTYEAKELGLSKIKYDTYPYDISIVITGNEINEYFRVLLKAMFLVFPHLSEKTKHLSHGMLRLPQGKMSSRTGTVITAMSLLGLVKEKILEKMSDREMSEDKKQEVAEIVAVGALKYSVLKQTIGKDIIFDFEKSLSFEGDSGPYLQYATVRANSILKKIPQGPSLGTKDGPWEEGVPDGWQTTNLERMFERFPSVVEKAGEECSPSYISTHLIQLAGEFNSFYASHKIIDGTDSTSPYKLAMTQSFSNVMTYGLNLLGIKVPDEM